MPQSDSTNIKLPDRISFGEDDHYSKEEEDALVINMSTQFADWIAAFLRRVILLFENLPEEGANGNAGGQTEGTYETLILQPIAHAEHSQSCRCRLWRIQPDLRPLVRTSVRYGSEHGL